MLKAGAIDRTGNGPNGYLAEIGPRVPLQWGMHEAQQRDRRGWFLRKAAFSRPVNRLLGRDGWRPRPGTSEASASCFGCQITPVYWPGGGFAGFSTLQTSIRRPKTVDWPPVGGQTADKFPVPADGALFHAAMVSAAAGSATGTIIITASAGASRPG
jgi:hypothetical protein